MNESPGAVWFRNHARLGGALLLLLCWGSAYHFYLGYLSEAQAGKPTIAIPVQLAALVSCGVLGLICLVGGSPVAGRLQSISKGPKDVRFYALIALCLVPGFLVYLWLRHQLASFGYK